MRIAPKIIEGIGLAVLVAICLWVLWSRPQWLASLDQNPRLGSMRMSHSTQIPGHCHW